MASLDARRAFQARLHQTSIEGLTRTVHDALLPVVLNFHGGGGNAKTQK